MAEAEKETIIQDLEKSLPTLEEFFYNDLEGCDTAQLPDSAKVIFYQEAPPETAEFLGLSANGALLSLKTTKNAFNISGQSILANSITGNDIRIDLSQVDYGGYDNIKAQLELFKANPKFSGYLTTIGAYNEDLYKRKGMAFAANMRLLFTNIPNIPRFTSTEVNQDQIITKRYQEVKSNTNIYRFCHTPYPYQIKITENNDGSKVADCSNYKNAVDTIKKEYTDSDEISFIQKDGTYYQVIALDGAKENRYAKDSPYIRNVLVLNNDKSTKADAINGYKAKEILINNIEQAKDIRVVLDMNALHNQGTVSTYLKDYPLDYNDKSPSGNIENYIKDLANKVFDDSWYQYAGYVPHGLDEYHRIHGVIYVQKEVKNERTGETELVWYNLNKMLIAETNNASSPVADNVTSPTDRYHIGYGPTELKPYTYNYANKSYVDAFWLQAGESERKRCNIQKQIFASTQGLTSLFPSGKNDGYTTEDDVLYKWTVSLGDVTFFIPPESIRVVSQTDTVRVPVMRARGTIAKGRERSMQYLELNLFFNEERGINGVPFKAKSPNKEKEFTYKMNGFRALLAQMKFTPFLPIINQYINEDLGIFAVCIENLNVSTVPGFPKLLKARILLSKFNYQVYMPEIPLPDNDSKIQRVDKNGRAYIEKRNPFSACIDYDTMRWYYQRCIMLGDELDRLMSIEDPAKRITVNSLDFYMRTIFANRTALLPCHFKDPNISVYIADEDHLKKLLQIKQDAALRAASASDNYKPTQNAARLIKEANILASSKYIEAIYAKYIGLATTLIDAITRSEYTHKEEVTDDGRKNKIVILNNKFTYKNKTYDGDSSEDTNQFLDACIYHPMVKELKEAFGDLKNEEGGPIVNSVSIGTTTDYADSIIDSVLISSKDIIRIRMNTDSYLTEKDRKDAVRESSAYFKSEENPYKVKPDDIFKNSEIALRIVYASKTDVQQIGSEFTEHKANFLQYALRKLQNYFGSENHINPEADVYDSMRFLNWCEIKGKGIVDANEEAARLKQSIDIETVHSLKYNLILDNALVTQFQASVGNTYARIGVSGIDGTAPQYMGGQDIHLSWTIETKDDYIASTFKSLPELTAYYTRVYRKVLPTYPIKIDSDFTRMMGVQEITLDNVVVTTVEGFPGLYRIVVNAASVDRTLRNREALRLLDLPGQGLEDSRKRTQGTLKSWKQLDEEFAKAEVYPDLELPKLSELGKYGWRYIRYRAKERLAPDFYVDPDFYFVYPELTVGRILIEALRCTFEKRFRDADKNDDIQFYLADNTGGVRVLDKDGQVDKAQANDVAKEDLKDRIAQKVNTVKQDSIYWLDAIKSVVFRIPFGSVDVGNKIRCSFMEPYYIQEGIWKKDGQSNQKKSNEVYEIRINTANVAEAKNINARMDAMAKTVNAAYKKIKFVASNGKEIKTIDNPNWSQATQSKIKDSLEKFEKCADEIKDYLTKNGDENFGEGAALQYSNQIITRYLNSSGMMSVLRKYGILQKENLTDTILPNNGLTNALVDLYKDLNEKVYDPAIIKSSTKVNGEFPDALPYLIQAAADSISGKEECSSKNKNHIGRGTERWQADFSKRVVVINGDGVSNTKEDLQSKTAFSFGLFGIKKYTFGQLYRILSDDEKEELEKNFHTDPSQYFVLDPYYRYKDTATKNKYLEKCATDSGFCAIAFTRNVMWYMSKLIKYHVIPSIEFDVKRQDNINIANANTSAKKFLEEQGIQYQSSEVLFTELKAFAKNNGDAFDNGKFFAAIILALTDEGFGKNTLFSMYNLRDYKGLNQLIQSITSVKYKARNENDPMFISRNGILRKYLLALYGYDLISDPNNLAKDITASPANKFFTNYGTKLALKACSNPVQYMRDSFFDMIRHDYRGRMLRAFPTFYMVFSDEGREVGLWKLHDNFYNFNAIHEIQIVKSRKIAADTCKITLSNMFQTFTTNDEDCTINYKGTFGDIWEGFFDPKSAIEEEELKRLRANKVNRAKLQTGVRIHVRMGYGANAADLPCCFNGVIAEIKPGELVEIVAQGDGVELCNPLYVEKDADLIQNNDAVLTMDKCVSGADAKSILQGFLTCKGGPIPAMLRGQYRNNFWGTGSSALDAAKKLAEENNEQSLVSQIFDQDGWKMQGLLSIFKNDPFGLRHFGNPEFRDIFQQGEPAQNLYAVTNKDTNSLGANDVDSKAYFGDGALDLDENLNGWFGYLYTNDMLPFISFKPYGKTIWDIMHICKSIAPDFMTGIADFQFRSTIFLGKPHYYYAYKYLWNGDSKTIYEKRKPYQQWHLYNNFSDIIDNKISASSEKMKTNAIGLYTVEGDDSVKKTDPIWVDQDIYSEYQKSMIVDTKLHGKSWAKHNAVVGTASALFGWIPLLGDIGGWLYDNTIVSASNSFLDKVAATTIDQRGSITSHYKMAENAVIDALKNSVKEMYQGYVLVLGDPSVKPNDRIQINDAYEDMSGLCDVREVVHTLNSYQGFTTTITPDAISAHDINNELIKMVYARQMIDRFLSGATFTLLGFAAGPKLYQKGVEASEYISKSELLNSLKTDAKTISTSAKKTAKELKTGQYVEQKWKQMKAFGFKIIQKFSPGTTNSATQAIGTAGKQALNVAKKHGLKIAGTLATAVITIISAGANSALYRTVHGSQTLYIFPLTKFGRPLTAGLDGQQGLVYGSIQFNTPGPLERFYGEVLAHNKENTLWGGFKDFIKGIFIDEDVMKAADSFDLEQDKDFQEALISGDTKQLSETDIQSISGPQLDRALYQPHSAYSLSLMPRAMVDGIQDKWSPTTSEIKETIYQAAKNRFYIDNPWTWVVNPNLQNLCYIEDNVDLKRFFDSGFLRTLPQVIMHNGQVGNLTKDNLEIFPVYMAGGSVKQVVAVKRTEKQNTGNMITMDIPYTSREGVTILYELCQYIHNNTAYITKKDDKENKQANKDTTIIISSALIAGSKNTLYGSGFHLILTGTGRLGKPGVLKKCVQEYHDLLQKRLEPANKSYRHLALFSLDNNIKKNDEVGINIGIPTPYKNNISVPISSAHKVTLTPKETDKEVDLGDYTLSPTSFTQHVYYSDLDLLNRCGQAWARLTYADVKSGKQKTRMSLQGINPAGYDKELKLYNRCHLIAHSLIGEEANPRNLVTGTKDMNDRMYVYEQKVAEYLETNQSHTVLYRVTPVYNGNNLLPSYVTMEATAIGDNTNKSLFNVAIYNTAVGWNIDYKEGKSTKK